MNPLSRFKSAEIICGILAALLSCENPVEVKTISTTSLLMQEVYTAPGSDQILAFKESPDGKTLAVVNRRPDVGQVFLQTGLEARSWQKSPILPLTNFEFFDLLPFSGRAALFFSPGFFSIDVTNYALTQLPVETDHHRLSFTGNVVYQNQGYDLCVGSISQQKFQLYNSQAAAVGEVSFLSQPGFADLLQSARSCTHIPGSDTLIICTPEQVLRFSLSNLAQIDTILAVSQFSLDKIFYWRRYLLVYAYGDSLRVYRQDQSLFTPTAAIPMTETVVVNFAGVDGNTVFVKTNRWDSYLLVNCQNGTWQKKDFPEPETQLRPHGRVALDGATGRMFTLSGRVDRWYLDFQTLAAAAGNGFSTLEWPTAIAGFDWLDDERIVFSCQSAYESEGDFLLRHHITGGQTDTLGRVNQAGFVIRAGGQVAAQSTGIWLDFYTIEGTFQYRLTLPAAINALEYDPAGNLFAGYYPRGRTDALLEWNGSSSPEFRTREVGFSFEEPHLIPPASPLVSAGDFYYSFRISNEDIYLLDKDLRRSQSIRGYGASSAGAYICFQWTNDGTALYSIFSQYPFTIFKEPVWLGP